VRTAKAVRTKSTKASEKKGSFSTGIPNKTARESYVNKTSPRWCKAHPGSALELKTLRYGLRPPADLLRQFLERLTYPRPWVAIAVNTEVEQAQCDRTVLNNSGIICRPRCTASYAITPAVWFMKISPTRFSTLQATGG
jgi:hypothetical protein